MELGGWRSAEAQRGATNVAQQCLLLGHPWIIIHPQSQLTEFLYLSYSWREEFETAWTLFRDESNIGKDAAAKLATKTETPDPAAEEKKPPKGKGIG